MEPKAKRSKKRKPVVVKAAGVSVRIFSRGANYWLDVRRGTKRERRPARTTDLGEAKANAEALALEIAKQDLLGVKPDSLTLGQLFAVYHEKKGQTLEGGWKKAAAAHRRDFLAAWGESLPVISISQTHVDTYAIMRRAAYVKGQHTARAARAEKIRQAVAKYAKNRVGRPPRPETAEPPFVPRPLRDGALDCDFRWLSSVLNWATRHKLLDGKRLLSINPLVRDCKWPKEQKANIRRPIASHDRYERTLAQAATIDATGRFALILTLARYTARRIDAILHLHASDILLSVDRIRSALAATGKDVALADLMTYGAIHWRATHDKQGIDRITPISPVVREEIDRYLASNPKIGDVPLIPAEERLARPVEALSRSSATKWLRVAEQRAGLDKLTGGLWHPYRRLWATERKHLPDVDVAAVGGWTGTKAMKLSYQQDEAKRALSVVMNAG